ncbi:LOW QUALITY PROTEIN: C-X-C chemokine receptor type 4-like [Hypomesus transpacificus]|uniref:LOW QUALITY PROTEIN: C-X-C chemokine receptor type 4-like n=1 Tax=Hypomesus transpacificus TaxID=137520 RepID=UPI001F07689D|nr:LOW QUALITY PROTEIN: C-X-C chemokine receptor type 4-like [Hypomesus transpacificus]
MSYYEHIEFDYDINDTGSGDLGLALEDLCDPDQVISPDLQRVFLPVVYGFLPVIFVLGIIGNGRVVMVLGCQHRSKWKLADRYRLHLSAADLLFVLTLPFWAADAALTDWRFGLSTCVAVHVIYTVNLYGSVLILAFISLDRYLAVVKAIDAHTSRTRQLLARRLVFVGAWLPAALLAVSDIVFARTWEAGDGTIVCQRLYPADNAPLWVSVFHLQLVFVGLVVPGLVLLMCYCVIVSRLIRIGPRWGQRQNRRAVRITVALVLCFFLCWLPYGAGITADALMRLEVLPRSCSLEVVLNVWLAVAEPMAFAHCCLNPLLYAFLGSDFKRSARREDSTPGCLVSCLKIPPPRRPGTSNTTEFVSFSLHSS